MATETAGSTRSSHRAHVAWRAIFATGTSAGLLGVQSLSCVDVEQPACAAAPHESLSKLEQGAAAKDPEAMLDLGLKLLRGEDVAKDDKQAFQLIVLAAESGLAEAAFYAGVCYFHGVGTGPQYLEAVRWFKAGAEMDDPKAQTALGDCFANATGLLQDMEQACKWWRRAADHATSPNASAAVNLATAYFTGDGVVRNYELAVTYFERAARGGVAVAWFNLGVCSQEGLGVKKDLGKAMALFEVAAHKDVPMAQYNLGISLLHGDGVTQDKAKAFEWLSRAADLGLEPAMTLVGLCYAQGNGVPVDEKKAAEWFSKADQARAKAEAESKED